MIWEKPIHKDRPIKDWIDDKDTGFQNKIIEVIEKLPPFSFEGTTPYDVAAEVPIISIADFSKIVRLCSMIKSFAPFADVAMWCDGSKFKSTTGFDRFDREICEWTDTDLLTSYATCDILVVSNVPPNTQETFEKKYRRELNRIIGERQKRKRNVTFIIGPNHKTLESVIIYELMANEIEKLNNGKT